jgi:hypothetical protein
MRQEGPCRPGGAAFRDRRLAGGDADQRELLGELVGIDRQPRLQMAVDHFGRRHVVELAREIEQRRLRRAVGLGQTAPAPRAARCAASSSRRRSQPLHRAAPIDRCR